MTNELNGNEKSAKKEKNELGAEDVPKSGVAKIVISKLGVNQMSAGAGVVGLMGFIALFVVATLFFITENYFISMFVISLALMVYVTGLDMAKIMLSSFTIFFSSKHLISKAAYIQETLGALNKILSIKRSKKGELAAGPLSQGETIKLPNNSLVKDMKTLIKEDKDYEYAEYIAHSYYVECHELYDYSNANLEFVANAMPLFGLIGTILGLIAMFDGLGANVSVESLAPQLALALKTTLYGAIFSSIYKIISSRFDQRLKALEYDYEAFCHGLEVVIENKNNIEVEL